MMVRFAVREFRRQDRHAKAYRTKDPLHLSFSFRRENYLDMIYATAVIRGKGRGKRLGVSDAEPRSPRAIPLPLRHLRGLGLDWQTKICGRVPLGTNSNL